MYRNIAELLEKEVGKERLHEAALHYIESPPDDCSVQRALTAITGFKAVFAHENALRCFEYVFKYKNKLTAKEILQSMIATCDSMFALGEARQAIRLINSALRSHSGVDPELKARLYLCLATAYRYSGDWLLQEQSCQAGLRTLRASPGAGRFEETMLWTELAFSAVLRSRVRNALHCLDRAMEVCPDGTSSALSGKIQYLHAILYCAGGELKKSIGASERAIAVLGHSDDHMQKCYALSMLGLVHMKRGRLTTALRLHLRAAAMGKKSGNVVQRGWTGGKLAECICRTGQVRKAFTAIAYSAAAAKESNNTAIRRACDTTEAEINLFACNYRETRRILKTLQGGEKQDILDFTAGRAGYVSANLNFRLGDFESALDDIRKICENKTSGDQYYEYDLAEALRERILFERDNDTGSLERLRILESRVAQKSLLFQRCIIMLHICEVSIRMKKTDEAEACARNMLRLAKGMRSASMQCRAYLMLGISRSPLQRAFFSDAHAVMDAGDADKAIYSLNACLNLAEAACSLECQWKALAELSFIYRIRKNYELCFHCAQKAHETLVKLEEQTPSDMMDSFHKAFGRGRIKQELAYLIETEQSFYRNTHAVKWSKNANGGILLQMTELVNSVREIPLLLDGLLALALPKIAVRRGMIFLLDEITGKLELAGQRGDKNDNMIFEGNVHRAILESVCREGKPLISSDAGSDPRITKIVFKELPGKLLCAPLKAFGRTIGVFYADSYKPVENISESEIDLAEAFCGLTALAVDNILAHRKLTDASAKPDLTETPDLFPEIIGASPAARLLKDHIRRAADSPLDVLITGESGSGKELVARAIRNGGVGRNGKFIPVDGGTFSDGIAETELFGCRKGAFTGATEDRAGLFEAASGGVLFLDEISNMPLHMQAKLLRVLQEREIRRIGETFPRKIELRVVAATNRNLVEDIKNGRFRNDLFHRLKGMEIYIPPLSERAEDIPLLAGHFLQGISDQGKGEIRRFSPEAMKLLQRYSYPGNIRELKNIVESAYYSSSGNVIEAGALPLEVRVLNVTKTVYDSVSAAENLYRRILAGEGDFDDLVKKPYLDRCFDASVVRGVIRLALSDSSGIYKDAFTRLRIPKKRYSAMMQFLKRRGCYLDFLPFRRDCE
jgi:DNA-binding NtrC family response regulator/tetratricopeptide (TPR) repeat protein